jgi:hypothetical protein
VPSDKFVDQRGLVGQFSLSQAPPECPAEMTSRPPRKSFIVIAETGDRLSDFAPYVASINQRGSVAFQAALRQGGTGIFVGDDGGGLSAIQESTGGHFGEFYSHPDIDEAGAVSFYAALKLGERGVFRISDGRVLKIADTSGEFSEIGPLGPTMNDDGKVAFRAGLKAGGEGIFASDAAESLRLIADAIDVFSGFRGLPIIDRAGAVTFRANLKDGGGGIYVDHDGSFTAIAETGGLFADLGSFPSANSRGSVAFCATLESGGAGVFTSTACAISAVVDSKDPFESFRGVLINDQDEIIFCATPRGGTLGIYAGPDPSKDRVLGIGDALFGSQVADFALNPVSFNDANQIAVRLRMADDRQLIVRVDPGG